MGTIAEKLDYLNTTKTNIKSAIVAKGVSVSDSDTFRSYADKIADIEPTLGTKIITANGTYTASDDSLQGYSEVTVDIDDTDLYRDTTDSTYESVKTLSNCGAFPMLSLKAEINAVQDLHGYDKPWAEGGGKNHSSAGTLYSSTGVQYAFRASTMNAGNPLPVGDYVVSFDAVNLTYQNGTAALLDYYDADNVNFSYPTPAEILRVSDNAAMNTLTQPLNGRFYHRVTGHSILSVFALLRSDSYGVLTGEMANIQVEQGVSPTDYAPYSNICPISGWDEVNVVVSPTTDAEDGQTYTIQFKDGDNPLTVYGGSLDVVSGVLTVDRASVDLGTLNYTYYSGNLFTASISNLKPISNEKLCNALCSIYVAKKGIEYASIDGSFAAGFNNSRTLAIHDSRFTDATAFKTAMNGVQLCYELATPLTIQLTPTQVNSLLGTTNLWADTGDVGDVRYFKKVEL